MSSLAADSAAAPATSRETNRDGFKVADMEYYDLLDVRADVGDLELKKAYRKMAIKNHPDKGGDEEKFKMIGEAYRVLSDNNLRADYDKHGKKKPTDEVGLKEATEMFGNLFGGERFIDLIGEISLLKDMGKASEIIMTEEEKEEMEKAMKEESAKAKGETPAAQQGILQNGEHQDTVHPSVPTTGGVEAETTTTAAASSATAAATPETSEEKEKKRRAKLTPEQRQKLEELEKEKEAAQEKRIEELTEKLIARIRPFVEAKKAGDKDDPETQLFERKMREEAEDLKLESFGVELLHAIGSIYLTKASTWIKTHKNNFLGVPGFLSKMKERGSMVKEGWNLLGSAVNAQMSMEDMAKRQEKGDLDEEALRELEMEMSGKMLLVTWRGTKWEVSNVLRKVCDRVLNDKRVKDQKVLLNRAKAIAFLGAIYKQVKPDENDDERRELERLVANASKKKEKHRKKEKAEKGTATPATGSTAAA